MGIDGYHQRSDQLMGSFRGTQDGTTDLPHRRIRGQHCAHREQPRQARRKNHGLRERTPDSGLGAGYARIFAWQMSTWTRTWESQEHVSVGCFLTKGAVFWVGGNSLMSTTILTLRHRAQLCTAKFWKRAPTLRRASIHLHLRLRLLEIYIMPIIPYGARCMTWRYRDLRSIRALQTARVQGLQHQKERGRKLGGFWTTQDTHVTRSKTCSSVRLTGRKLHDRKCTNAQDTM